MLIEKPKKGKYVTFEGINGAGKTFYLSKFKEKFKNKAFFIIDDKLSGVSLRIFEAMLNKDPFFRSGFPVEEALCWYAIDLIEFEKKGISNLNKNKIVIQDRGMDTTALYAAISLNKENNKISVIDLYKKIIKIREDIGVIPDLTILFIDDFDLCLKRVEERDNRKYSKKEIDFLKEAREGFEKITKIYPNRIKVINKKNKSDDEVLDEIKKLI